MDVYDNEFFKEHDINLFDKLLKSFENNNSDRNLSRVEQDLSDLEDIINFVNLVSDEVIRKILKEIK